jgi:hypothetical protein
MKKILFKNKKYFNRVEKLLFKLYLLNLNHLDYK